MRIENENEDEDDDSDDDRAASGSLTVDSLRRAGGWATIWSRMNLRLLADYLRTSNLLYPYGRYLHTYLPR